MPKWIARMAPIVALVLAGCAGQGQFSDGGMSAAPYQPPPPPLPAPPPAPAAVAPAPPPAQTYFYPTRGPTPQQEESDKGQCYVWAVQQTGFDPANPRVASPPPPQQFGQPQAPQGGLFRGAAGGAALGAVGGAIGGNAGEGAAIGAGVGALFGGLRRMRWEEEQQQQQQQMQMQQQRYMAQQQSELANGRANYQRAFSACMAGRGYTPS